MLQTCFQLSVTAAGLPLNPCRFPPPQGYDPQPVGFVNLDWSISGHCKWQLGLEVQYMDSRLPRLRYPPIYPIDTIDAAFSPVAYLGDCRTEHCTWTRGCRGEGGLSVLSIPNFSPAVHWGMIAGG